MSLMHLVTVSSYQVQTVHVTSPVPRVSLSPQASLISTPTTWSAPSSLLYLPAWMSPSPSSPLTWRTTPCQVETGTASTTGWKCGTGCQEVSCLASWRSMMLVMILIVALMVMTSMETLNNNLAAS